MDVVLERRGREQEHVAAEAGDGRDRAPGAVAGVAGRPAEPMRLVDHHEVDARRHRLLRQPRARDERLQRDDGPAMHVERVEVGAEVARHVGQPVLVEEGEHLVVLPPHLAQPLHGQRLRGHDEAALDAVRAHQAVQDEAGLDRLAQADLVREEPAHGVGGARALRGVELVREEPDAAAEERAQAARLAQGGEVQRVQADREVLERVDRAGGETLDEGGRGVERLRILVRHRHQGVAGLGQAQARAVRELDHDRPLLDLDHAADAEVRVVAVCEAVAEGPGSSGSRHGGSPHHCSSKG